MINGVHLLLFSSNPEADRAFFRDVLKLGHVDAGEGWLIFALPPSELGIHPAEKPVTHLPGARDMAAATVYLMCDNLGATLNLLASRGVVHGEAQDAGWGIVSSIALPGGSNLGLYQPRHPVATAIDGLRA